jgi:chromate reductase
MPAKKNIFAIIGSASTESANEKLVRYFAYLTREEFEIKIFNTLKELPHFDPGLSIANPPEAVQAFRNEVEKADGILICTPEYVFSIPSGLKNAIEWCVATTVFSGKPAGLITASTSGRIAHKELQLIMKTIMAKFNAETSLLIEGIKGKMNAQGEITDPGTIHEFGNFIAGYRKLFDNDLPAS